MAAVAVLAWWAAPGYAHDGVKITIEHDGRGSVWATLRWQDGHPVTEDIDATVSAREFDGQTISPEPMRTTFPGEVRYGGTLSPGRWTVTVDVAQPARGTCAAVLMVGPDAAAESVRCDDPPGPAAATPPDAAGGFPLGRAVLGGLLAVAAVGLALLMANRWRPTPA